ncbi:TSP1-like protein [Mya arenaria]|uniref:TSP1-like protein n=1 Tax=Mya arenaria TaxID=6604 RepID=A0ABY7DEZ6_MYAAR|nr:TSP1-like protein [Mya arenaria]
MTTRCEVEEGMDEPQYIPDDKIVDVDDETPDDVGKLRPNSNRPFVADKNKLIIKFWFMPAVPVESVRLPTADNVDYFTVSYLRPRQGTPEVVVASEVEPSKTVRFPGQPDAVDVIITFYRANPNQPMKIRVSIKACFKQVTTTTTPYTTPMTQTTPYISTTTSYGTTSTTPYTTSTSSSEGTTTSYGTATTTPYTTSTSEGTTTSYGTTTTTPYTSTSTAEGTTTSYGTTTTTPYTSTSTSEGTTTTPFETTIYVTPTTATTPYTTSSVMTTRCEVEEGMDEPQYIPDDKIVDVDDETPDDVGKLRPNSNRPFVADKNKLIIKFWFMPAVPVESVRLPTADNVDYFTVSYLRPRQGTPEVVVASEVEPSKTVRFPGQPDAVDVIITFYRANPNQPMKIRVSIKACFKQVTTTTTPYTTPITQTTPYISTTTSYGTTSTTPYTTSTSSSEGTTTSYGTATTTPYTTSTSEGTTTSYGTTTTTPYTSTSTPEGTTTTPFETTIYVTPTTATTPYTTSSVMTTRCEVEEGMDEPQYIPDDKIVDVDDETPDDVGKLRPNSNRPFVADKNKLIIKFWFMPAVPVESVRLPTADNVDYFTVSYLRPRQGTPEVVVASEVEPSKTVRFPGQPDAVDVIITFYRANPNQPMKIRVSIKACFKQVTTTTTPYTTPMTQTTPYISTTTSYNDFVWNSDYNSIHDFHFRRDNDLVWNDHDNTIHVYVNSRRDNDLVWNDHETPYTSTSTSEGTTTTPFETTIYVTPTTATTPYTTSSVMTTRCEVEEGMDEPQYIPDDKIVDVDDETPDDVGKLRPNSNRPFVADKNKLIIKFWFMPAVPVESVRLPTADNVDYFTVSYLRPRQGTPEVVVASEVEPSKTVRFPGQPDAVDVIITFYRANPNQPMKIRVSIKACFKQVTTTTTPYTTPMTQTTPYISTTTSYGTTSTTPYTTSTSSSEGTTTSYGTATTTPYTTSTSEGTTTSYGTTTTTPYTSTSTPEGTTTTPFETTIYVTPTTATTPYTTSSVMTTRCEVEEGMDEPQYIPDDKIVDVDDETPDDVGKLRPNSNRPFVADKNKLIIKFWFMPAVPVESVRLPTADNVDYFTVSYLRPRQGTPEVVVASEVEPSKTVRFPGQPDAVDVIITFYRANPNQPMKIRVSIKACFKQVTTTTTPYTTPMTQTTPYISTTTSYGTTSTTPYTTSTSSSEGTTTSYGTATTTPYTTSTSEGTTTSYGTTTTTPYTSTSTPEGTTTTPFETTIYVTPTTATTPYTTSSVMTTRCEVEEGMDEPQYIPDDKIVDVDDETPDDVGKLRPNSNRPFVADKNKLIIKFWFMPAVPVESVRLPTADNVDYFTVSYLRPRQGTPEVVVASEVEPSKTVRFPGQPDAVDVIITFYRANPNQPMKIRVSIKACFKQVTTTTTPYTTPMTQTTPYISTTTSYGSTSTTPYTTSTSSSEGTTTSYGTATTTPYTTSTSEGTTTSYGTTTTTPYTSTSTPEGTTTTPAVCLISKGMDSHSDIPDKNIRTNDPNVNEDINKLRPEHNSPAKSRRPNFKVTIDLPYDGVILDRVVLPDNKNIKGVVVYYIPAGEDTLVAINNEQINSAIECNDRTLDVSQLVPGNSNGPAKSYANGLMITLNFDGGAAMDKLELPTHTNIHSIKILILLPGEINHIPFNGGQPIIVTGAYIQLTPGIMANQIVIIVVEKLDPDAPILITVNIWACFDIVTTPSYSSSYITTQPPCDLRMIDYDSNDVSAGASSEMPAAKAIEALKGSDGFWSPRPKDSEEYPFIQAKGEKAAVYKVSFSSRFSKFVVVSLYNKRDKNVDTSDKIRCQVPSHHKRITYNFYGQVGDKVYVYVSPYRDTQPQISDLEIHACYDSEVTTTPAPTTTTTPEEECDYQCDAGTTCLRGDDLCNGKCDCFDCSDEENCATTTTPTEVEVCGPGYQPVEKNGKQVTCGGFVGAQCPRGSDLCEYPTGSSLGFCCRPVGGWSSWSPWSRCTRTCGDGETTRYRKCNKPEPGYNGKKCRGDDEDTKPCKEKDCQPGGDMAVSLCDVIVVGGDIMTYLNM